MEKYPTLLHIEQSKQKSLSSINVAVFESGDHARAKWHA
jgi:hypothetical protein